MSHSQIPPSSARLSVTIPHALHQRLSERANLEGRSISNLAAFLLEYAMTTTRRSRG